jgi:DNA-directed RNA polymerase specialized sigma24 family protein
LKDDLHQEVFLVLLNYPDEKIEDLYRKKQLMYFVAGILITMWRSPRSDFYRTYRQTKAEIDVDTLGATEDYNPDIDRIIADINLEIDLMSRTSNGWYKARLLKMETEFKSHHKIADATGINRRSISRAIADAKQHLRARVNLRIED